MGELKQINIKNRTYYFCNDMINLKSFKLKLLKTDKNIAKGLIFTTLDTSQFTKLMIMKVFTA